MVIIDTTRRRADFNDPSWGVVTSDPEAILYEPRVVWQPPTTAWRPTSRDDDSHPLLKGLGYILDHRADRTHQEGQPAAVTVVVDELRNIMPPDPHPRIVELVTQGMGNGVGCWGATQGPYGVYFDFFSNCIHVVSFTLIRRRDARVLEADTPMDADAIMTLRKRDPEHGIESSEFLYWRQGMSEAGGPYVL